MIFRDFMKYIESEYTIVNNTPCEVCGGQYEAEEMDINILEGIPYDTMVCTCSKCGHERIFSFTIPVIDKKGFTVDKKDLN